MSKIPTLSKDPELAVRLFDFLRDIKAKDIGELAELLRVSLNSRKDRDGAVSEIAYIVAVALLGSGPLFGERADPIRALLYALNFWVRKVTGSSLTDLGLDTGAVSEALGIRPLLYQGVVLDENGNVDEGGNGVRFVSFLDFDNLSLAAAAFATLVESPHARYYFNAVLGRDLSDGELDELRRHLLDRAEAAEKTAESPQKIHIPISGGKFRS